jgi:cell division protein FtsB
MTLGRWIAMAVLLLAGFAAYGGGMFGQHNFEVVRREEADATRQLAQLQREVDSLKAFRDSILSNPAVQERYAREHWGMARPGEMLFTITRDSAR